MPAGPIYRMDEVFADPQVMHLGMAKPVRDPERGDVHLVGLPIDMSRTPPAVVTSVPDPGMHEDEILGELGFDADQIDDLRTKGAI